LLRERLQKTGRNSFLNQVALLEGQTEQLMSRLHEIRQERILSIEREIPACRDNIWALEKEQLQETIKEIKVPSLQAAFCHCFCGFVSLSHGPSFFSKKA
jgi:hypothetical protein